MLFRPLSAAEVPRGTRGSWTRRSKPQRAEGVAQVVDLVERLRGQGRPRERAELGPARSGGFVTS